MNEIINKFLLAGDKFIPENLKEVVLMNQIISVQMNFINQLLENLKKKKFIQHLEIIFGTLI